MAETLAEYLDRVTALFAAAFESAHVISRDDRIERCLLEMVGQIGAYRVRLLEVVTRNSPRKYAYYVLQDERVIAGFDNASDAQVRRLKYGDAHAAHRYERIPHRHGPDKAEVELTDEVACADFIAWVQAHCG
jgi:hypothetical protein